MNMEKQTVEYKIQKVDLGPDKNNQSSNFPVKTEKIGNGDTAVASNPLLNMLFNTECILSLKMLGSATVFQ